MITKEEAEKILQGKLGENLVVIGDWDTDTDWVFMLGFKNEDGDIIRLVGDSTVHINKETGEID